MDDSNISVRSHASQAPTLESPSNVEPSPNQLLQLPEELLLDILSHMERHDILKCSSISRAMNRIAIQSLLSASGITRPTTYCKLVLDILPQITVDPLMVLLYSVHIKEIKDLSFYFTRFTSYSALISPLRRTLRLLRLLISASEVTLYFGTKEFRQLKDEKHFKDVVPIYEDILNEIVMKSTNKIRVFGSEGLLGQYYEFRKLGPGSTPRNSKLLTGVKDYLDRRQDRNSEDPIVLDDLRYSRTSVTGSRIFLRCSPEALKNTKLTHCNIGTADFLRPPFSQWMFPMLKASKIGSLSFAFSRLPKSEEEIEFILKRLASVLPHLLRLYLFDIKPDLLPTLIKWINRFPSLRTLQIEPFVDISDDDFAKLQPLQRPDSDVAPNTSVEPNPVLLPSGPFKFASHLRRIDAPHQFLAYFFSEAGPGEDKLKFPVLDMVHLDYFCIKGVKLDLSVLANALKRIRPVFAVTPPGGTASAIVVHLKFEKDFNGLTPSICEGHMPSDIENAQELADVEKVRLGLPGTRDEIMQGQFNAQILGCVTIFSGLKHLKLTSTEYTPRRKEDIAALHFQIYRTRNPNLKRVDLL